MQISTKTAIGISLGLGLVGLILIPTKVKAYKPSESTSSNSRTGFVNVYGGPDFLSNEVRGLRNNNPGNIRISNTNWQGKVPVALNTDGSFEQFVSYPYGIRALIKLLNTYYNKYQLQSVSAIINRFAPSNENNTKGYINEVAQKMKVTPEQKIPLSYFNIKVLVFAIDFIENGKATITQSHYKQALKLL